jgi:sulfate/thiosulfate transport system permease protein
MAGAVGNLRAKGTSKRADREPRWVRYLLITISVAFLVLFLVLPLYAVLSEAFATGWRKFISAIAEEDARSAIYLTLIAAGIAVPLNTIFGIAAAWALAKFRFWGRNILITLIDIPFAISPIISGLIYVLLYGKNSPIGGWLQDHGFKVIFAVPGVVLATIFVTFPFVAREVLSLMEEQGTDEEQAALVLGASGFQTFWRVTLPNIKWALLYGVILCNARAMGEYGAVAVVAGSLRGSTVTLPLHVELQYTDMQTAGAFACATVLAGLGLVTLIAKTLVEHFGSKALSESGSADKEGDAK